mmetsp:Transcript_21198/g.42116  ORF Transcript_21198/g.42116 Transcript_21198/m.42116 type:complete len:155 (+) Transcript_21198:448-912(+)
MIFEGRDRSITTTDRTLPPSLPPSFSDFGCCREEPYKKRKRGRNGTSACAPITRRHSLSKVARRFPLPSAAWSVCPLLYCSTDRTTNRQASHSHTLSLTEGGREKGRKKPSIDRSIGTPKFSFTRVYVWKGKRRKEREIDRSRQKERRDVNDLK